MTRALFFIAAVWFAAGVTQVQAGDASAGQTKYENACAQCHGASGGGAGSFPSLQDKDADFVTKRLRQYREGERVGSNTGLMAPAARDLSDDDIANLSAYISTEFQ